MMKQYAKNIKSIANNSERKTFLIKCRQNLVFPNETALLLSFGPKFSLLTENENVPVLDILTEIESTIKFHFEIENQALARANLVECLNKLMNNNAKLSKTDRF